MVVNSIMKFTILYTLMVCFTQGISQNTPSNVVTEITTTNPVVSNDPPVITKKTIENPITTTPKTEIRIKTLPPDDAKLSTKKVKSGKKELDNPSSIIDMHKSDDPNGQNKTHGVSGRKGVDASQDVVTAISTDDHENDLNNLKNVAGTTTTPVTTTQTTPTPAPKAKTTTMKITTTFATPSSSSESIVPKVEEPVTKEPIVNDTTPKTSLLVGIVFGCLLLSVLMFVGFKRLDAIRRRREYRRMNDFLIDGMYNEM